jgi:two-component system sensor histidine kinase QseC
VRLRSARRALIAALVLVVTAVSAIAAALSYREGRIEADELFDAKLAHSARVLAALVDPALDERGDAGTPPVEIRVWHGEGEGEGDALTSADGHVYETRLAFQVRDDAGRLLLRSDSGPAGELAPLAPGYADRVVDGDTWRVFTLRSAQAHWVQAAERADIRAELAADIARGTMAPMLLALPVLALLVWLIVAWAGRALARVSAEVGKRAADSLEPLPTGDVPDELAGLVGAINDLLARLREAWARERRFTADAAHELRTPVAALRVHAANLRSAADDAERAHSLARIEAGIARIDRLSRQLLDLEREDPSAPRDAPRTSVDLAACARREIAEILAALPATSAEVSLDADGDVRVDGDEIALSVLLRNLVDNALRYTPDGGRVAVSITPAADRCELRVDDSGPGIAPDERARALERFHRGLGHKASGSGLGLSIAQRVVERHGGTLSLLDSPLGGLRVEVVLPRHAPH